MTQYGIRRFCSLSEAIKAGYEVYDRTEVGYLVRTRTVRGWALAVVVLRSPSEN
jgi:hypothetical protein